LTFLTENENFKVMKLKNIPRGFSLGDSESQISIPLNSPAYPQVNLRSDLLCKDYIIRLTTRLEDVKDWKNSEND